MQKQIRNDRGAVYAARHSGGLFQTPDGDRGRFYHEEVPPRLQAPRPYDVASLWNYLHECAHGTHHSDSKFRKVPKHVKEYEAEVWTLHIFQRECIEYPNMHALSSEYLLGQMQDDYNDLVFHGIDRRAQDYLALRDRQDLETVFNQWAAGTGVSFRNLLDYERDKTPDDRLSYWLVAE